jgi:hypothetical protein
MNEEKPSNRIHCDRDRKSCRRLVSVKHKLMDSNMFTLIVQ